MAGVDVERIFPFMGGCRMRCHLLLLCHQYKANLKSVFFTRVLSLLHKSVKVESMNIWKAEAEKFKGRKGYQG